jgi:hypothetical protein
MEPILQYIPETDYHQKYLDLLQKHSDLQDEYIETLRELTERLKK